MRYQGLISKAYWHRDRLSVEASSMQEAREKLLAEAANTELDVDDEVEEGYLVEDIILLEPATSEVADPSVPAATGGRSELERLALVYAGALGENRLAEDLSSMIFQQLLDYVTEAHDRFVGHIEETRNHGG